MSRNRYTCYLWPTTGDRQPARFLALAVESALRVQSVSGHKRVLRLSRWDAECWSCQAGEPGKVEYKSGKTAAAFWALVSAELARPGVTWCIVDGAHDAMLLLGLWERLERLELLLDGDGEREEDGGTADPKRRTARSICLEHAPFIVRVRIPGLPGTLQILEVENYGITAIDPGLSAHGRCQRVGASVRAVARTLAARGLGSLQATAASQSLYTYRRRFLAPGLGVHCRAPVLALERGALHGGRAECYRLGTVAGPIYQVDFSSFYPSICAEENLPVRLREWGDGRDRRLWRTVDERRGLIARVRVETQWPHLPLSRDGIVIYPTGRFTTTLTGPDLWAAWDAGEIADWYEWASYDMAPVLRDYARETIEIRRLAEVHNDKALAQWAKAIGNALVGKFAQRGVRWQDCPDVPAMFRWGRWSYRDRKRGWVRYRSIAGHVQREEVDGETKTSFPALAAYVYALGRRRLWGAMLVAGRDQCYYCHTDGCFLGRVGYGRLRDAGLVAGPGPGKLRLVAVHDWLEVYGLNHYRVPGRTVCAGQPTQRLPRESAEAGSWRMRTVGEAIGERTRPSAEEYLCHVLRVRPYRHGQRGPDGTVEPWRL